jgi:glucose-6-phosphate-specific signal transduction histidine kinase
MLEPIKHLLAPPIFEGEEEKTRTAGLIHTIAMSALLIAILFLTLLPIFAPERSQHLYYRIGSCCWRHSLYRPQMGEVCQLFLTSGLWLFTATAITTERTRTLLRRLSCKHHVGDITGWQAVIIVSLLSILSGAAILIAEKIGILPPPTLPITPEILFTTQAAYLIMTGILLGLAIQSIERAFTSARQELAERKRFADQAQRRADELVMLNEISRATSSMHGLEETFDAIFEQVKLVIPLMFFCRLIR